jgi:ComF family protein
MKFGLSSALGVACIGCGRSGTVLCHTCAAECRPCHVSGPVDKVDRVIAPWLYEDAPRRLILGLKLRGRRDAATPLTAAMATAAITGGLTADVLTWVPGRRRDTRRRGFDHAELLAQGLGSRLGLPVAPLIHRVSDPPDQTSLTREQRHKNLAGVFEGTTSGPFRVAIVDDLVTTGATLTACAAALRATGTMVVEAVVGCRA